jgi:hypothetical protein
MHLEWRNPTEGVNHSCAPNTRSRMSEGKWHVITGGSVLKRDIRHVLTVSYSRTRMEMCILWSRSINIFPMLPEPCYLWWYKFTVNKVELVYWLGTRLQVERPENRGSIPRKSRDFSLHSQCPDQPSDSRSLISNGYRGLLPAGLKRPGREADHSPPTSAEVKNTWNYTSISAYVFMKWYKQRRNFRLFTDINHISRNHRLFLFL